MAKAEMQDDFYADSDPHLPPEQPMSAQGGQPPIGHRSVMKMIGFVLVTDCRWEDVPRELGCSGTLHIVDCVPG